ncbi:ran-binding protein 1 homolog a-like [Amaranthus tricolor]|uniref:ran-binding protein 1 homolog a-like n=1 Tax=Amaranthus tricolor TaxID=29722 RepID=UPI002586C1D8|nr:ran-binding protein 1 homolog a-like [Amaranthus tricolor]
MARLLNVFGVILKYKIELELKEEEQVPEEDTGAQIAPIVRLEEVAITTGQEDENALLDLKAKLYKFDKEENQWKERGSGTVKFLKRKVSGKVQLLIRQSKALEICANHLFIAGMTVQEHVGNERSCVWHASDYADGELKEMFCIRFASIENNKNFMEMFQEIAESQQKQEENKDAYATAEALEKLSVGGEKSEEKAVAPAKEAAAPAEETKAELKKDDKEKGEDSSA